MSSQEDQFLKSLRATFKVEADEHLQAIARGLLELEKTSATQEQRRFVETVFRAAHSLKGAARAVDSTDIEAICQSLEDVFAAWKRQESGPSPQALDAVHRALDNLTNLVAAPSETLTRPDEQASFSSPAQAARPEISAPPVSLSEPTAQEKPAFGETVR